jgi:hypothetical protein
MKTNSKKLNVKRETIRSLNTRQLQAVVGGTGIVCYQVTASTCTGTMTGVTTG